MNHLKLVTLLVLLAPLFASLFIGLLNKKLSKKVAHSIAFVGISVSLAGSCALLKFFYTQGVDTTIFPLYSWADIHLFKLDLGCMIDRLNVMMMVMVTFISWLVHLYSMAYMQQDSGYQRFFCYISFFTFAMLVLVLSHNFLQLFFAWEMVGLASYLLIGFWFHKNSATFAGLKAFLINRVGDCGFLIGIAAIAYCCGSLEYGLLFEQIKTGALETNHPSMPTFICLALFIGAMGKSAQIPLHAWLPDSMEGPTPISALIHAATMVTAGVFMIARLAPLFESSLVALNIILVVGAITSLLMGWVVLVQNDIKRIIAYSTLSQLGYMMMAMGASAFEAGIFHLLTHACFKALLFLAAGSIIMRSGHEQNIWKLAPTKANMPITYTTMLVGSLALIGFPFFSGFYSKDFLLEGLRLSTQEAAPFAYYSAVFGVLITTLYTFRLFFVVFHKGKKERALIDSTHESSWRITLPLMVLALFSFGLGALVLPAFQTTASFKQAIDLGLEGLLEFPFALNALGVLICYGLYVKYPSWTIALPKRFAFIYAILSKKYGFDTLYLMGYRVLKTFANFCSLYIDQFLIDGIGVNGTAALLRASSIMMRRLQTGYVYHYAFMMIVGFMLLLGFCMLMPND